MKCDLCGQHSDKSCYISSDERSTKDMKTLWKLREDGIGFEGWIIVCNKCEKNLQTITKRNSIRHRYEGVNECV